MSDEMKVTKRSARGDETKSLSILRAEAAGFQSIYADNTQLSVNYFGLSMLLGEVMEVTDGSIRVLDHVKIHMSPEHAATLHQLLGAQIEKYISAFGKIRPVPEADKSKA